jgi:hypothetical protein
MMMLVESEEAFMSDHEVVYRVVCPDGTIRRELFRDEVDAEFYAETANRGHDQSICNSAHVVQSGIISWDE